MSTKKKINFIVDENKSSDGAIIEKLKSEFGENFSDDVNVVFGDGLKISKSEDRNYDVIELFPNDNYALLNGVEIDLKADYDDETYKVVNFFEKGNENNIIDVDMENTIIVIRTLVKDLFYFVKNAYILDRKVFEDKWSSEQTYINKEASFIVSFPSKDTLFNYKFNIYKLKEYFYFQEYDENNKIGYFVLDGIQYKFSVEDGEEKFYKLFDGEYVYIEFEDIPKSEKISIHFNSDYHVIEFSEKNIDDGKVVYCFINNDGIIEFITDYDPDNIPVAQLSINGVEYNSDNFKNAKKTVLEEVAGSIKDEDFKKIYDEVDKRVEASADNIKDSLLTKEQLLSDTDFISAVASKFLDVVKIQLVAKNGDAIDSSLVYDEDKHSYILDYDTSLLDGTDYTIELKLS